MKYENPFPVEKVIEDFVKFHELWRYHVWEILAQNEPKYRRSI
jgi:hypothetical protein